MAIDERLLVRYMETFVGFGSLEAPYWFVGMEQGGGESIDELGRRLEAWRALGSGAVLDLRDYCERLGETRWHGPGARIQPTLGKIVRVVLAARGSGGDTRAIRSYQSHNLGRSGGETLIAELMPLPSRSIGDWIYGTATTVPSLRSREAYRAALLPTRTRLLQRAIDQHAPHSVVFLGWSYKTEWQEVVGHSLEETSERMPRTLLGRRGKTTCVVCQHPTSFGASNGYFAEVGLKLPRGTASSSPSLRVQ